MPKLIVFPGAEDQYELDLSRREKTALGRDPSSDVVVPRRMASRHHAVIERLFNRYFIRDTESYNSTFVNNRPVREAELIDGDEIRIAHRVVRFVEFDGGTGRGEVHSDTLNLARQPPVELLEDDLADTMGGSHTPGAPWSRPISRPPPRPAFPPGARRMLRPRYRTDPCTTCPVGGARPRRRPLRPEPARRVTPPFRAAAPAASPRSIPGGTSAAGEPAPGDCPAISSWSSRPAAPGLPASQG